MARAIIPPYDNDAEKSVLASIMLDRDALIKGAEILYVDDFYVPAHQTIFQCCLDLFEASSAVDIVTVKSYLTEKNLLDKVGGTKFLTELVSILPITTNVEYYSRIIKEDSLRRKIISVSSDLVDIGLDETKKIDEIIDEIEKRIFNISQKSRAKGFSHIKDILLEGTSKFEELQANQGGLRGVSTGFNSLNNLLGGFHKGNLVIIAARPSVGKTAFMLEIARHMAVDMKKKVAVFSLEMNKDDIANRLIALQGDVHLMNLMMGDLHGEEYKRYQDASGELYESDIYIDDTPGLHISELRTRARKIDLEIGLDAIFVDYLQLLHAGRGGKEINRALEVSEISQSLKNIARELEIPVIALSQLNRSVESRNDRRPQLSDLRESGSIEQDADMVMFLHREAMYNRDIEESEKDKADLIIAKHRNGATGMVQLRFIGELAKYKDLDQQG